MKKYRLIEYTIDCSPTTIGSSPKTYDFESMDEAVETMLTRQKNCAITTYRIKEIEESIMDRVKSYEDACGVLGVNPIHSGSGYVEVFNADRIEYWCIDKERSKHLIALLKLEAITAALNEGWKPDWEDMEQEKWQVIVNHDAVTTTALPTTSSPFCLSRLYFKSLELAEYAAKQFADLYKQLLVEKF